MSLRHALLALLTVDAMTGYDLAKQFDQSVAYVWHAPHSQIYPELRRLEASGLVTATSVARGARATKRAYQITQEGRAELRRWVEEVVSPTPERDAAHLKASYLEFGSFDNARRQFEAHLEYFDRRRIQWEAHVARLKNRDTDLLRSRLAEWPEHLHDAIVSYKVHVYQGLAKRARLEVEWARKGLEMTDELEAKAEG